jgi:hypothetical protein
VSKEKQNAMRWLGALATGALLITGVIAAIQRSDSAVNLPRHTWHFFEPPTGDPAEAADLPQYSLLAPLERDVPDAGVARAAREFAMKLITPNLKSPESAEFPEAAIHFERLSGLNATTDNQIEHWLADGVATARNGFGVRVPVQWRIMIGRADDSFFPVTGLLEGVEVYRMQGHAEMLLDARQRAWQERQDQAAARKANELAQNRALWKARDEARPLEDKARAALKLATILLNDGRTEPGRKRLQEVIDKFPGTTAAAEAEELLKQ